MPNLFPNLATSIGMFLRPLPFSVAPELRPLGPSKCSIPPPVNCASAHDPVFSLTPIFPLISDEKITVSPFDYSRNSPLKGALILLSAHMFLRSPANDGIERTPPFLLLIFFVREMAFGPLEWHSLAPLLQVPPLLPRLNENFLSRRLYLPPISSWLPSAGDKVRRFLFSLFVIDQIFSFFPFRAFFLTFRFC